MYLYRAYLATNFYLVYLVCFISFSSTQPEKRMQQVTDTPIKRTLQYKMCSTQMLVKWDIQEYKAPLTGSPILKTFSHIQRRLTSTVVGLYREKTALK